MLFSVGEKDMGNFQKKKSEMILLSVNPPLDGDAVCGNWQLSDLEEVVLMDFEILS